jgi:antitoxin HicB
MNKIGVDRDMRYYLSLPYTIVLRRDEEGDFVARVQELPGCSAHGSDRNEALSNLQDIQRAWIEECLESGQPVPEPEPDEALPSGKWLQRVPRSLHKKLADLAKKDAVSLNTLVTSMLSAAVSERRLINTHMTSIDIKDVGHGQREIVLRTPETDTDIVRSIRLSEHPEENAPVPSRSKEPRR